MDLQSSVVSLDFFHVFYDDSDIISMIMAWVSLAPQTMIIVYLTQFISRREVETLLMFGGQLGNELCNEWLKSRLRQERPRFGKGYGMPSAHAQFVFFHSTYICLWMLFRVRHFSARKKILRAVSLILMAAVVSYSRVYLYYHTPLQVLAGVALGIVIGTLWFVTVLLIRDLGIVDLLLDTPPARWFYIKDTAGERASFVRDEYAEWRRMRTKMKLLVKVE